MASLTILLGNEETPNWLVTTAIGGSYFSEWQSLLSGLWLDYARHHGLGLAVAQEDVFRAGEARRSGAWQKMLAPRTLRDQLGRDIRCCLVDTDVLISPGAPDIFASVSPGFFGVVSQERSIPMEPQALRNRVALLRQQMRDSNFPLSSSLNATPEQLSRWANVPKLTDYFCSGVIVLDTYAHADKMERWYSEAPGEGAYNDVDWGEELWLNSCIQAEKHVQWLPYAYQALWIFEVAAFYPFLYSIDADPEVAPWCLAGSLMRNHFLHLAGSWEKTFVQGRSPSLPGISDFASFVESLRLHEKSADPAELKGRLDPPLSQGR